MKKKSFTYVLLIIVVLIWVGVFFRIKSGVGDQEEPVKLFQPPPKTEVIIELNSFELLLNYKDPFKLKKTVIEPITNPVKKVVKKKSKPKKTDHQWPEIKFSGIIENKITGKQSFIIRFDRREYILSRGDSIGNYLIASGNDQLIEVKYGNETKQFEK